MAKRQWTTFAMVISLIRVWGSSQEDLAKPTLVSQANSSPGRIKSLVQEALAEGGHLINCRRHTSIRYTLFRGLL